MKFSIVTPSFRNSEFLKLCVASVADQQGVELEHIIQDACSDDGTQNWLPHDRRVKAFIEKDDGMYDAINRGYRRATGDILAHINSDEQYLPGALKMVHDFFEQHPKVEVLMGGVVVVEENGNYLCHRHAVMPGFSNIWHRFSVLTASLFLRRKVVHGRNLLFDTRWRASGDFHWILEMIKTGVPMAKTDYFTSAFIDNGENLSLKPIGRREAAESLAMAPAWVKLLKPVWIGQHRLRRVLGGHFSMSATSYDIYTPQSPDKRVHFDVPNPTGVWRTRIK